MLLLEDSAELLKDPDRCRNEGTSSGIVDDGVFEAGKNGRENSKFFLDTNPFRAEALLLLLLEPAAMTLDFRGSVERGFERSFLSTSGGLFAVALADLADNATEELVVAVETLPRLAFERNIL